MSVIYEIFDSETEEVFAFPSLKEAKQYRSRNWDRGFRPEVTKVFVLTGLRKRDLMCRLIERRHYASRLETVVEAEQ